MNGNETWSTLDNTLDDYSQSKRERLDQPRADSLRLTGSFLDLYGAASAVRDDYGDNTGTRGRLTASGSVAGAIETAGDVDWFRVALRAGATYTIELEGSATARGSLTDPFLVGVFDRFGDFVPGTADDDGGVGYNSRLEEIGRAHV